VLRPFVDGFLADQKFRVAAADNLRETRRSALRKTEIDCLCLSPEKEIIANLKSVKN